MGVEGADMINRRDDKDRIKDGSLSLIYLPYGRLYPDTYIAIVLFYQVVPVQADRRPKYHVLRTPYTEYSGVLRTPLCLLLLGVLRTGEE